MQVALFGQGNFNIKNAYITADFSKAFIMPHHESFKFFVKGYLTSFDFTIAKQVKGDKNWHHLYNLPYVGIGYSFVDLGNKQQLGNANTIYPFISFSLLQKKRFSVSVKCAAGVAWLSKHFDIQNNVYNIAIGSHLNAYLGISANFDYMLTNKIALYTTLAFSHFSNGGTQQPNKGINVAGIKLGAKYYLKHTAAISKKPDNLQTIKKKNEFSVIYSGGIKTLEPARRKKYYVSSLSINAERLLSQKSRVGVGIDFFKDNSREDYLRFKKISESATKTPEYKDRYYVGCHLSYDLVFGKTSFTIQTGAYVWQRAKSFQAIYNRFGIKYRFSRHWMANLTLKTFWAAADFAEWGIGYRF